MVSAFDIGLTFVVLGVLMLIWEATSPGFFIAVPATVLIALGMLGMAVPELFLSIWSPIIAVIVAVPATYITMQFYAKLAPPSPPVTTVGESLVGKVGTVTAPVVPHSIRGKVKIDNDIWSATADQDLPVGSRVRVIASRGVHVVVQPLDSPEEKR